MNWMNIVLAVFFGVAIITSYSSYKKKELEFNVFMIGIVILTFLAIISLLA